MFASPVRALVWPEWGNLAAGLLIFIFSGFLRPEERNRTDRALRIAAWGTAALAGVQALVLKSPQVSASLTNPNALALFVVMLLPLAASWKDWWLAGALLVLLIWTQSAGAAIALISAAGFYMHQSFGRAELKKNLPIFVLLAIALVLVISQVPTQSFIHRLLWWKSAVLMFLSNPFLGFGHAAFTFVYPAYRGAIPGDIGSIYAHSYYLEFLAENGLFCAALWFGLLVYAVKKKTGLAKYSLIAALAHGVIDFGLSVPANFWIFCYLAAPDNREHRSTGAQEHKRTSKRRAGLFSSRDRARRGLAEFVFYA
ncbi:MAG: O-antigen ligase family protein [Elusimicrobia bacterium]|nr:O-antigen ligase family protein [Elusimicrobiota bacterium]